MRRDFLRTLFSRMLATYLTVALGLVLLVGVTVVALFEGQIRFEVEGQLARELTEICEALSAVHGGDEAAAREGVRTLEIVARQSGGLVEAYGADGSHETYYTEQKWAPAARLSLPEQERESLLGTAAQEPALAYYGELLPFRTISQAALFYVDGAAAGAALLHLDFSISERTLSAVWMEIALVLLVAVLFSVIAVYYTTSRMIRPFSEINAIVQRYSKGDFNIRIPVKGTDEATQLAVSFNNMADQLRDLEATRRDFVSNVSHELRSPLTSMRGFLEAMQDGTIPRSEYDKYIDVVLSETRRMTTMVNDLLDLARIESGRTALKLEIFDINELIRRTLITFEARIYDQRMEVEVKFAQEQYFVEADSAQISQVLRNIIDNAIKYSPAGGRLRIATYALRREVYVSIQDSGQGIPEEDVPHVFERFYKVEKAHTPTKQGGTGLGPVHRQAHHRPARADHHAQEHPRQGQQLHLYTQTRAVAQPAQLRTGWRHQEWNLTVSIPFRANSSPGGAALAALASRSSCCAPSSPRCSCSPSYCAAAAPAALPHRSPPPRRLRSSPASRSSRPCRP